MAYEEVKNNRFFNRAKRRARGLLSNKERLNQVLAVAAEKIHEARVKGIKNSSVLERLKVITRIIKAYIKGDYRQVKLSSILLLVAAIIYFVTPLDLIPDFVPVTGLIDDFTVITYVYSKLQEEINAYLLWENNENAL